MSIVVTDWYKGITKAAQLTAKDVYSIVRSSIEDENKSDEEFAEKHEFYDALPTAFGDDEEEGLEFDWNVNLALLWICGLRPTVKETEEGKVLLWNFTGQYNRSLVFKQAYMDATVELQNLLLGENTYCQRSFLTILEKLVSTHKVWRKEDAPEHMFILEYAVIPNQPFF
ncbi:hypothetical protein ABO35_000463 [Salmonella enterica subsp. enterica serovar Braenderup]|nr:hypothetical protein [Salmonella enterica subsp. enterica serovar Braenderup]